MFGSETFHVLKGVASFSTICRPAVADFHFHISWKLHPWLVRPHQQFDLLIFSSPNNGWSIKSGRVIKQKSVALVLQVYELTTPLVLAKVERLFMRTTNRITFAAWARTEIQGPWNRVWFTESDNDYYNDNLSSLKRFCFAYSRLSNSQKKYFLSWEQLSAFTNPVLSTHKQHWFQFELQRFWIDSSKRLEFICTSFSS